MQKVIVTGGAGFIGGTIARQLVEMGVEVVVIDNHQPDFHVAHVIKGGIEFPTSWDAVPTMRYDAIIHLAARTSVLTSIKDPDGTFTSNVLGSHNVLEFARRHEIPSVVLASTNAAVGIGAGAGLIRSTTPLMPLTPYGSTKAAVEMLASAYHHSYDISTSLFRLTNVYGPRMWKKDSVIPRLFRHTFNEATFSIYGDGKQVRDYVYVEDVANAFITAAAESLTFLGSFGSQESISVNDLVDKVAALAGRTLAPEHIPAQKGEMPGVSISTDEAERLDLVATTLLDEGLQLTWEDYLKHRAERSS